MYITAKSSTYMYVIEYGIYEWEEIPHTHFNTVA